MQADPPFLPHLLLFLCLMFPSQDGIPAQPPPLQNLRSIPAESRWLQGVISMAPSVENSAIRSSAVGDFNGDGRNDLLIASEERLEVAWNSKDGLAPFTPLAREEAHFTEILWDGESQTLWCARLFPERVEAWTFNGTSLRKLAEFPGNPRIVRVAPGVGLTALGRVGRSLELLFRDGHVEVLIPDASELMQAGLVRMESGEQLLLLQEAGTGRIGSSVSQSEEWEKVNWWPETEGTLHWEMRPNRDGGCALVGQNREELWFKEVDPTGRPRLSWTPGTDTRGVQFWWAHGGTDSTLVLCIRKLVTTDLVYLELHRETGRVLRHASLNELSVLRTFVPIDLDGDGLDEWMHPHENEAEWMMYMPWSLGTRRLWWRNPDSGGPPWPSPLVMTKEWKRVLADPEHIQSIWTHDGGLFVQRDDRWTQYHVARPDRLNAKGESSFPYVGHCHQLTVSYLERGTTESSAGIAEVTPGQWHHLAFIRRDDLHTEVWFDGQCRFLGRSQDLRYQYNALLFGASYGTGYHNYGAVTLDRVILSGQQWTGEVIQQESEFLNFRRTPFTAESWSFDALPLVGDISGQALEANFTPRLAPGRDGMALSFDGRDNALRTFVPVPMETMTLSFHFRLDNPEATTPQSTVGLYGMFNTDFTIRWAPRHMMDQPEAPGIPIRSPRLIESRQDVWPMGATPFMHDGHLHLLDADGQVLSFGPLGWQVLAPAPEQGLLPEVQPWTTAGSSRILDADGRLLRLEHDQGWSPEGVHAVHALSGAVAATEGAFFLGEEGWNWYQDGILGVAPRDSIPRVDAVSWTPFGDMVAIGRRPMESWHPQRRSMALVREIQLFTAWPSWWFGLCPLIFLIPLLLPLGWWWRRSHQAAMSLDRDALPPELRDHLLGLAQFAGTEVDTPSLDQALLIDHLDTDETRRARRARLIRECNEWSSAHLSVEIIERRRDSDDRRRAKYWIEPILESLTRDEPES